MTFVVARASLRPSRGKDTNRAGATTPLSDRIPDKARDSALQPRKIAGKARLSRRTTPFHDKKGRNAGVPALSKP
jgi:hypothetical protein